ncbi:flagellar basal body rod protein FlgC [Intestinimonas butyriciproducens]|uniref:flagellar basal body rod protein FlgC n=1 Tax=Intestinimonas butyriciproducens TaxID=1297617 RepID=UPI00195928F0|nr:flagellar basal body rod protein FlgC [Intestinimonas butyriciproducens]MBM6977506.1 flagellar basal body rod protein FlgC [Intestinimonas butyriciproducens]
MAFLSSMNVVGSGLTAQQFRLDVISENITNASTTRTEAGGAYRRKVVVLQEMAEQTPFQAALARARGEDTRTQRGGVQVTQVVEDPSDFKLVYDPTHPDANADGYVEMPNVDLVKEIADAMAANQAYSANATAFNVLKQVAAKGLEIGK